MFEKEAEEYADTKAKKLNVSRDSTIIPYMQIAWQKGAEFGYNKANEWHYVNDGDLPKEKKEYWCKVFYYESEETFNAFLWFDPSTKEFKLDNIEEDEGSGFKVKEWCEIPEE